MISIEHIDGMDDELGQFVDVEFNKFADKNGVTCDYMPFSFLAKEDGKIVGIVKGHSYYMEVYIGDLIVLEEYRKKNIGTKLIEAVEEYYMDKGFENINLTTYSFQAPEFYEKCGFQLDFIRENKENPKLTKYFFVKYF